MFAGFNREVRNSLRLMGLRIRYAVATVEIAAEQYGAVVANNIDLLLTPRGSGMVRTSGGLSIGKGAITVTPSTYTYQSNAHAAAYLSMTTVTTLSSASATALAVNGANALYCVSVGTGGTVGISISAADSTEFGGVGTQIGGNYYHRTILGNRPGYNDTAQADVIVTPGAVFASNTNNITGANTIIKGGNGAASSALAANGGHVYAIGGRGYGTGARGQVRLGTDGTNVCRVTVRNTILGLNGYTSSAADPTTTELATAGDYGIHKNTTSGTVYLVFNDSGTIKKVALA